MRTYGLPWLILVFDPNESSCAEVGPAFDLACALASITRVLAPLFCDSFS